MEESDLKIPNWLTWKLKSTPELSELKSYREEMLDILSLYYNHVKQLIGILLAIPTAALLIYRIGGSTETNDVMIPLSILLIIIPPYIAYYSRTILRRYYDIYVSHLIYSTSAHIAAGQVDLHPWFQRTLDQALTYGESVRSTKEFSEKRAENKDDTFAMYFRIIRVIASASLVLGLYFLYIAI